MNRSNNTKKKRGCKNFLKKTWHFIWFDDSLLSWFVNVVLAFLIVKFIFYPALSFATGTSLPLVAVTSPSMEHRASFEGGSYRLCGVATDLSGRIFLEDWWALCGDWYVENSNISFDDFKDFPLRNGFNKGDIIFLKSPKNLEVGDVIVFESGKIYPIIHRVIEVNDFIVTKGDNNPGLIIDSELDERRVSHDAVIGKAYGRLPYFGYVKIWFTGAVDFFLN